MAETLPAIAILALADRLAMVWGARVSLTPSFSSWTMTIVRFPPSGVEFTTPAVEISAAEAISIRRIVEKRHTEAAENS